MTEPLPSHRPLLAFYWRLMLLGTAGFVCLLWLALWMGWRTQRAIELDQAEQRLQQSAEQLRSAIAVAEGEVDRLTRWANGYAGDAAGPGAADLRRELDAGLARSSVAGTFTLDGLANVPEPRRVGQMIGRSSAAQPDPVIGQSPLSMALPMLARMDEGQRTSPLLAWSYFISADRDLLAVAPWVLSAELRRPGQGNDELLEHSPAMREVSRLGAPAQNPQRAAYWMAVHPDPTGAVPVVSHARPVYWGDRFVGVVVVDMPTSQLAGILGRFAEADASLWLVDAQGRVLAAGGAYAPD